VTLVKAGDFVVRGYWAAKTTGSVATADADKSSRAWFSAVKYF
jgi:hypothetical protein